MAQIQTRLDQLSQRQSEQLAEMQCLASRHQATMEAVTATRVHVAQQEVLVQELVQYFVARENERMGLS